MKSVIRKGNKVLTLLVLLMLGCSIAFVPITESHGYIKKPASRAYLCSQDINVDCGLIKYEPQSLEAFGSFPESGPPDGLIASAGIQRFHELDEQSKERWSKVTINGGKNIFEWHLTAAHSTKKWNYYITKKNWNANTPLSRADLELIPFCSFDDGGARPPYTVSHECYIPTNRTGYHLILGVWEIADTGNSFYQVIDVNLEN